jgi:SAM-dependent methyltransferase
MSSSWPRAGTRSFIRWAFYQFYNRFAFTYDWVSAVVSRGQWRAWTRAAIPFITGERVLELAFGTGGLHLDLHAAGYSPVGVDLSPHMHEITHRKFRAAGLVPLLVRAHVRALPFPSAHWSSVVMTFPPGFAYDPEAMAEIARVVAPGGRLIWVDAPLLDARDWTGRFLNWAFAVTGGCANPDVNILMEALESAHDSLFNRGWTWQIESVSAKDSRIHVIIGTRREHITSTDVFAVDSKA